MGKFSRALTLALLPIFLLNGCVVGYRKYPRAQLSTPPLEKQFDRLFYKIEGTSLAGGYLALRDAIRLGSPFRSAEERSDAPPKGLFVNVQIEQLSPSVPSIIFTYISLISLTFLPAWSTKDGSIIRFQVLVDGDLQEVFSYEVRRFGAVWIGFLPLVWVNLITANESEAFRAVAKQFFVDGKKFFK